jgi:hypothetical protein
MFFDCEMNYRFKRKFKQEGKKEKKTKQALAFRRNKYASTTYIPQLHVYIHKGYLLVQTSRRPPSEKKRRASRAPIRSSCRLTGGGGGGGGGWHA